MPILVRDQIGQLSAKEDVFRQRWNDGHHKHSEAQTLAQRHHRRQKDHERTRRLAHQATSPYDAGAVRTQDLLQSHPTQQHLCRPRDKIAFVLRHRKRHPLGREYRQLQLCRTALLSLEDGRVQTPWEKCCLLGLLEHCYRGLGDLDGHRVCGRDQILLPP